MRWYCVSPSLPRGAQLRVRAAPSASADETSALRLSISDIVAVSSAPTPGRPWLRVLWQQQEGHVMATTPDDMPLLVPWETTALEHIVFANPETPLRHAKTNELMLLETDAYLGVIATSDETLLVMYQGDQFYACASDTIPMAERIADGMRFLMNPTLPENATIVVRQWPDRESDQVDVITQHQEVTGEIRSGDWIKLHEQAWVMWKLSHHNNLQLLQPAHIVMQETLEMPDNDDIDTASDAPPALSEPAPAVDESQTIDERPPQAVLAKHESWDDRPIRPAGLETMASLIEEPVVSVLAPPVSYEDRPIRAPSTSPALVVEQADPVHMEPTASDDAPASPSAVAAWDDQPIRSASAKDAVEMSVETARTWDDRPIQPAASAWDDRPIKPAPNAFLDARPAATNDPPMDAAASSWDDRPIKPATVVEKDALSDEQPETNSSHSATPNQSPTQANWSLSMEPPQDATTTTSESPMDDTTRAMSSPPISGSLDVDKIVSRETRSSSACSDWEPLVLRRRSSFEEDAPIVTNQVPDFAAAHAEDDDEIPLPKYASRLDEMLAELSDVSMMWLLQLDLLEELFHHLELHGLSVPEMKRTMEMLEIKANHALHAKVLPSFLRLMPFVKSFMASAGDLLAPHMEHLLPPFFSLFQERSKGAIASLEAHLHDWFDILDIVLVLNSLETAVVDLHMTELGTARLVTWFAGAMPRTKGVPRASPRLCDALVQLTSHRATKVRDASTQILTNILGHYDGASAPSWLAGGAPETLAEIVADKFPSIPIVASPPKPLLVHDNDTALAPAKPRPSLPKGKGLERKVNLEKSGVLKPWQRSADDAPAERKPWQRTKPSDADQMQADGAALLPLDDATTSPTVVASSVDKVTTTDGTDGAMNKVSPMATKPWVRKATPAPSSDTGGAVAAESVDVSPTASTAKPWLRAKAAPSQNDISDDIVVAASPKPRRVATTKDETTPVMDELPMDSASDVIELEPTLAVSETPTTVTDDMPLADTISETQTTETQTTETDEAPVEEVVDGDILDDSAEDLVVFDDDPPAIEEANPVLGDVVPLDVAGFREEESADEDVGAKQSWFFVDEHAEDDDDDDESDGPPRRTAMLGDSDSEGSIHALSWEASPRVTVPVLGNTVYDILGSHPLEYFSLEPPSDTAVLSHHIIDAQVYDTPDEPPAPAEEDVVDEMAPAAAEDDAAEMVPATADVPVDDEATDDEPPISLAPKDAVDDFEIEASASFDDIEKDKAITVDSPVSSGRQPVDDLDEMWPTMDHDEDTPGEAAVDTLHLKADDEAATSDDEARTSFFRGRFASDFDEMFPEDDEYLDRVDDGWSRVHSRRNSDVSSGGVEWHKHDVVLLPRASIVEEGNEDDECEPFEPEAIDRAGFFDGFETEFPTPLDATDAMEALYVPLGWWIQDCHDLLASSEYDSQASLAEFDSAFCMLDVSFAHLEGDDDAFFWDDPIGDDIVVSPADWAAVIAYQLNWQRAKTALLEDFATAIEILMLRDRQRKDDEAAWAAANDAPTEQRSKSMTVRRSSVYGSLPKRRSETTLQKPVSLAPTPSALLMPPRIRTSVSTTNRTPSETSSTTSSRPESPVSSRSGSPKALKKTPESPRQMPRPRASSSAVPSGVRKPVTASALAPPTRSLLQPPTTTLTRSRSVSAAPQIPAPRLSTTGLRPPGKSSLRAPASRMSLPKPVTKL
ncbi:hypothetical protein SPRG_03768 [Saprolegnia parasitica CBS 223.65]|uniref:Uncharacterized protein n=1 Tax=Saprolegnia parasitica (strain CBS 223.65) TaxID=695850 RepID=A0A067CMX4_SAPPC|nr:hypothetical protein SPRG_03768 [Saprolegnia parasitica CBS 223.65]KDO31848.1 hypothetical protein SPRG_03768 [Saprolegnia parasitica CBS 223.65]|eukprot:XP_012197727.1 hypothetical protein SPRG_03768 [Saprolegnia parasitica CBS 223.65]